MGMVSLSSSLFSQSWYRVAEIKPRLRSHAQWVRHSYRGEIWYVLRDQTTGKLHRFSESAKLLIEQMDGEHSMQDIWHSACEQLGDNMPSQDEALQLLSQLYRANALQSDVMPDMDEIYRRQKKEQHAKWMQYIKSPMALRFPLWNPDKFLTKSKTVGHWLFSPLAGFIYLFIVIAALVQVGVHWQAISSNFSDQAFSASNWLALALVYPIIKLLHELGHGYAVKRWGGDVNEMGVMFLVFMPVPYVDASASSLFRSKHQRMFVAAAGILVESFLAAVAALLWVYAEPGIFRAFLFNVMLIGGVSTILFNGNPLLRFDAYYVLADWLEFPNFGKRANKYIGYLLKRYTLKQPEESPCKDIKERFWLAGYSIAAFCYRMVVMVGIALFVATEFFFIGVMLAMWSLYQSIIAPLVKVILNVWPESSARHYRLRLIVTSVSSITALYILLFIIPLPSFTVAQGVFWAPEETQLHAGADCFIREVPVTQGQQVSKQQALIFCESTQLKTEVAVATARLTELQAMRRASLVKDVLEASILRDELQRVGAELSLAKQRIEDLTILSPLDGQIQLERVDDLAGRFIIRGSYLGYVNQSQLKTVRVAVPQSVISRVRSDSHLVLVRSSSQFDTVHEATVLREVPEGSKAVVASALTTEGGGNIALDPSAKDEIQALENWFQFDLQLPSSAHGRVGERVYVRFEHSYEPLGELLWRNIRRVFLKQFSI